MPGTVPDTTKTFLNPVFAVVALGCALASAFLVSAPGSAFRVSVFGSVFGFAAATSAGAVWDARTESSTV